MDFPSTKSVHEQSDSTGPQESSPAAPSAAAATFERQLSEIANSDGGGGAMPAASALQSAQSTWVLIGRQGKHLLYSEDARLISGLEKALIGNPTHRNAGDYLTSLRSFGGWLFANNKTSIVARLNDPSLTHDAREFEKRRPSNILAALNHLRTFQSTGGVTVTARTELNPHPQDADLINEYKKETATSTGRMYATALRSFGHYLRENNKKGIATRLSGGALDEDVNSYKKGAGADSRIGAALAQLRKSQAGAKAMEPERHFDPKDAALMESMQVGDAAAQHSASQQAGSWSEELNHLRTFQSTGGVTVTARTELNPHPQDADLINEYKKETATSTGRMYATALRSFGHYLRENNKKGIATRLSGGALDEDINSYKKGAGADSRIGAALAQLRKSQAGANAMELERHIDPKDAALMESMQVGDAAAQHSASQQAGSWPEEFLPAEGHDQDLGRMDEPGPSSSAPQPAQSTGILRGRRKPLYSEDAPLISGLEEALRSGNAAERTAKDLVGPLRAFGRWLLANNKTSIVDRLEKESLTDDAREFIEKGKGSRLLIRSIGLLRTFQSTGGVTVTATTELNPYLQDAALIIEYQNEAATSTGGVYATALRSFGHHLRENNKKGIATRLSGGALDEDVEAYKKDFGGIRTIDAALGQLRKSQAGAKAMERERYISPGPDPEGAALMEPRRAGDAAAQHSSQEVGSWPEKLLPAERHEQDLVLGLMDEPGPSSSLEPVARHDQASDPGDSIRPLNWRRDGQQFSEEPMAALARSNLPPSEEILINDEQDAAELRPAKRPRTLDNPQGLAIERLLSEIAATPAPTHQQGASPWHAQPMMQASGHEDATAPHAAATYVAGAAAQHSAPQGAVSRPLVLPEGYDRDLRLMGKDGPSWPEVPPGQAQDIVQAGRQQPAWSASTWSPQMPLDFDWSMWPTLEAAPAPAARARSGTYGGLESLVHLDAPTPSELRDDAHFAPAPAARARSGTYGGLESLVHLDAPTPSELRDDAHFAPAPAARARSDTYGGLESLVHLDAPTPSELRDDAHFAPAPAARARSDTYGGLESLVHLDAPTPSELRDDAHFAAAPFARARSDAYRGFPLVDLTAPTPSESRDDANSVRPFPSTSANAQIGALDPTVSSHGHGLVLDDTEWLGDQHIDRDYGLQEQDLQRNDPDLAARTRFVNPLIALNYLRSNDDGVVLTEFQRIVYDDNGNDTADFLFLPVINGNPEDPNSRGNHWSLLFVDRSDRWRPVAYHYDSYGGLNNRDAAHLARRLNLPLELADMAQQQNTYDCGVFVVDGTRELVRQLAQGWEPDQLNLSNVVANRQALQNRLRG
ncbi:Ulp1 family isopeptidase [Bradyrhizobium elkanii]|uniref:BEL2_5 n=1 Tax=Bradyrhizobium elkanii TaxID=29448 RepID=A0A0K0WSG7_BRAEL|nr:Ulp1 family isopeptidase [Bradyrhizobium elkanii]AKS25901.1 BEL2_5 [Bradyrhizobium elkanii]MCP1932158.1 hypothetical protein [Bradyrhizobium elkanii]MCS3577299.1 hypothetical protein [Bradyrhizobium elkanii]MCS3720176.1 hypothetical protein [Bradyrhizobium elkanii]MCS4004593.1 hypothetical protein [Bradyrhizobium elkanii USDA 61]